MPYKKNYRKRVPYKKRKNVGGRARFKRVGSKAGSMAYTAFKMAKRLMDAVNIEYKFIDTTFSLTTFGYTGGMIPLNVIALGTNDNQRIGDSVKLQNLVLRYSCQNYPNTVNQFRVLIVWDKQNKISGSGDVLEYSGSILSTLSPKKYDKRFETKILYDRVHLLDPVNKTQEYVDVVIPINEHTQFDSGTTTVNTGALKLIALSNDSGSAPPHMNCVSRVTFTDN